MRSNFSLSLTFMDHAFGVISNSRLQRFSPGSFIVLRFTFIPIVHFGELLHYIWNLVGAYFFPYPVVQIPFAEKTTLPSLQFCQKSTLHVSAGSCIDCILSSTGACVCSFVTPQPWLLWLYSEPQDCYSANCTLVQGFLFFVLVILVLLHAHTHFRNSLSVSTKNPFGILVKVALNL